MSDHYYTPMPTTPSDEKYFDIVLRGVPMRFTTDSGVFSKHQIDRGTKLLIENMPLPDAGTVLDLGCGYGPIGLVIAKLRPKIKVVMVDVNERACALARRNAVQNDVVNVTIFAGNGFEPVHDKAPFAAIVTNPPYRAGKKIVYSLMEQAMNYLVPEGKLVVVGQTKQGIKSLKGHLEQLFGQVEEVAKEGGYRVLAAMRRTYASVD